MPVPIYYWDYFSIYFVISFLLLVDGKSNNYDIILVVINYLTKMVYYKLVKVTIDIADPIKIIIIMIINYHSLPESIVSD